MLALLTLLLQPLLAFGMEIECDRPEILDQRIQYCSDNVQAVQSAQICKNRLLKAFRDAGPELKALFQDNLADKQKHSFQFTESDYKRAGAKLNRLIDTASENMYRLASYPPVMLDDDDHLPCYTENFEKLEKIVGELDEKITELKTAREANASLLGISKGFNSKIENENKGTLLGKRIIGGTEKGLDRSHSNVSGKLLPEKKNFGGTPPTHYAKKNKKLATLSSTNQKKKHGDANAVSSARGSKGINKNISVVNIRPNEARQEFGEIRYRGAEIDSALGDLIGGAVTGQTPDSGVKDTPSIETISASENPTTKNIDTNAATQAGNADPVAENNSLFHSVHKKYEECFQRGLVR